MNENGVYPDELYEIQQTIVDNEFCYEAWDGDITNRMMCADVVDEIDSCNGKIKYCFINENKHLFMHKTFYR
jgi:hypothetical protein